MNIILRTLLLGSIVYLAGCNQGIAPPTATTIKEKSIPPTDAFWQAVKEGKLQDVRRYIENERVDVNAKGKEGTTPLHVAVLNNDNIDVAKYLIKQGANVNTKDNKGWTPFHFIAIMLGFGTGHDAAKLLLENGADIYAKNNDGETPIDLTIEFGELFRETTLDFFREHAERGNPGAKEALQRLEKIR